VKFHKRTPKYFSSFFSGLFSQMMNDERGKTALVRGTVMKDERWELFFVTSRSSHYFSSRRRPLDKTPMKILFKTSFSYRAYLIICVGCTPINLRSTTYVSTITFIIFVFFFSIECMRFGNCCNKFVCFFIGENGVCDVDFPTNTQQFFVMCIRFVTTIFFQW